MSSKDQEILRLQAELARLQAEVASLQEENVVLQQKSSVLSQNGLEKDRKIVVNGNQKCSDFGNSECSIFGIKTTVLLASAAQ